MGGWVPLAITTGTVLLLALSGAWANRRFADFEQLPGHFDWQGRASRMTPRKTMVWLLPITFSVMMIAVAIAMFALPEQYRNGDPLIGIAIASVSLIGGQALVLWLTERWARQQRGHQ